VAFVGRFLVGTTFLFRGLCTLLRGGRIRRWAIAPLVLNGLLFVALMFAGVWAAVHYTGQAAGENWWSALLQWLAALGAAAVLLTVAFFTFGLVAALVAAPFNELISQGTERILTGRTGELKDRGFMAEMARAGLSALKMFAMEMAVVIPAMLLLLVPLVGPLIFAVPAAFFLALTYMDYSLDRRKLGVRAKIAFCIGHFPEVMGFGLLTYVCTLIPFVNVLTVPVAAVAGTRLFLRLSDGAKESASQAPSEDPEASSDGAAPADSDEPAGSSGPSSGS
jgi:CysZ protein